MKKRSKSSLSSLSLLSSFYCDILTSLPWDKNKTNKDKENPLVKIESKGNREERKWGDRLKEKKEKNEQNWRDFFFFKNSISTNIEFFFEFFSFLVFSFQFVSSLLCLFKIPLHSSSLHLSFATSRETRERVISPKVMQRFLSMRKMMMKTTSSISNVAISRAFSTEIKSTVDGVSGIRWQELKAESEGKVSKFLFYFDCCCCVCVW